MSHGLVTPLRDPEIESEAPEASEGLGQLLRDPALDGLLDGAVRELRSRYSDGMMAAVKRFEDQKDQLWKNAAVAEYLLRTRAPSD